MPLATTGAGGVTPGAPLPLSGANYTFIAHPAYCFSDASHVVPCNPGDSIQWFYDPSAAAWFQQATSGSRMILRQTATKYYAELSGSQYHPWANSTSLGNTAYLGAAFQIYSNITYQMVFSGCNNLRELRQYNNSLKISETISSGSDLPDPTVFSVNTDLRYVSNWSTAGGTSTLYRDGSSVASGADSTSNGPVSGVSALGGRPSAAYMMNGRIYGAAIFQTNPGVSTLQNWLRGLQP